MKRILRGQDGQGMVELGLILALVVILCIAALTAYGNQLNAYMMNSAQTLVAAMG